MNPPKKRKAKPKSKPECDGCDATTGLRRYRVRWHEESFPATYCPACAAADRAAGFIVTPIAPETATAKTAAIARKRPAAPPTPRSGYVDSRTDAERAGGQATTLTVTETITSATTYLGTVPDRRDPRTARARVHAWLWALTAKPRRFLADRLDAVSEWLDPLPPPEPCRCRRTT